MTGVVGSRMPPYSINYSLMTDQANVSSREAVEMVLLKSRRAMCYFGSLTIRFGEGVTVCWVRQPAANASSLDSFCVSNVSAFCPCIMSSSVLKGVLRQACGVGRQSAATEVPAHLSS